MVKCFFCIDRRIPELRAKGGGKEGRMVMGEWSDTPGSVQSGKGNVRSPPTCALWAADQHCLSHTDFPPEPQLCHFEQHFFFFSIKRLNILNGTVGAGRFWLNEN